MKWFASIIISTVVHAAIIFNLRAPESMDSKLIDVALVFEENVPPTTPIIKNIPTEKPKIKSAKINSTKSATAKPTSESTFGERSDLVVAPQVASEESNLGSATYEQIVLSSIESKKRYPRSAQKRGIIGTAVLSITIGDTGDLIESEVSKSSGYDILDSEVLLMAERAAPFPNFPKEFNKNKISLLIPVEFQLN